MNDPVQLWPQQLAAIEAVQLGITSGLAAGSVILPTGTGKTGTVLSLARRLGWRTLFLVHRDRLIKQTIAAAGRFWPEATAGIVKGGYDEWDHTLFGGRPDLVVASVQSLHERRLQRMPRDLFGLVVVDEAHHAASPSWARIIERFHSRFRLGVTATPVRLDGKGLATWFGREPLYSYSLFQAIADGRLAQVDSRRVDTKIDLSKLDIVNDFVLSKLADAVNTPERNGQVVDAYIEHGGNRRAVAFCVDVAHCIKLADAFSALGIPAVAIHSKNGEDANDRLLDEFAAGKYQVATNCEVLTEGFDDPGISCLLMARPTMSRALYIQMIGRGLRLAPGKTTCLAIDFTDNCEKHKLACSTDLFGRQAKGRSQAGPAEWADETTDEKADESPLSTPILSWKLKGSNPWPELPSLDNYESLFPWDDEPSSDAQMRLVKSFGLEIGRRLTKGEAGYLIDRCKEFDATFPTPATAKQRAYLEYAGLWRDGMTKRQASVLIGAHHRTKATA